MDNFLTARKVGAFTTALNESIPTIAVLALNTEEGMRLFALDKATCKSLSDALANRAAQMPEVQ